MKGLLLKDFYNLSKLGKQYLLIFIGMSVWAFFMKSPSFLSLYIVLCSSMLVLTSFSYDEYAKFEKYALTMPIQRKTLVREKYVLLLLSNIGGTVIGLIFGALLNLYVKDDIREIIVTSITVSCVFLISYSVVIPTIFKSGVEKARMMMVCVYLLLFVVIYAAAKLMGMTEGFYEMSFLNLEWVIPLTAVIAAALVVIFSYLRSVKIIEKREW